jgi:hypothetical protein
LFFDPNTIELCAHVTAAPEESNKTVLSKGIFQESKDTKRTGGQIPPIAVLGFKLNQKKAQKKAKKNITSEAIKSSIPSFKPF